MVKYDWLRFIAIILQANEDCAQIDFKIQMEEANIHALDMGYSFDPQSQIISPNSLLSQDDQQTDFINLLISQGKPIFTITEFKGQGRNQELSQQERIKQKILNYNRKEKSLEELSRKFIDNFQGKDGIVLQLDKVTTQLRVERRRIYDIVNIFESLQVMRKVAKNNYVWRGLKEAKRTIQDMSFTGDNFAPISSKKEKSLQNLAARFLKLFIFSPSSLSLEIAAKQLIHSQDSAMVKTKIRRLYDIVNVFKSIGLVQKVHLLNKKPTFEWLGTKNLEIIIEEKRKICQQKHQQREESSLQKQNNVTLPNRENINQWFSQEEKKSFFEIGLLKQFSQKLFMPSIIKNETSVSNLPGTQQTFNDICAQY